MSTWKVEAHFYEPPPALCPRLDEDYLNFSTDETIHGSEECATTYYNYLIDDPSCMYAYIARSKEEYNGHGVLFQIVNFYTKSKL